MRLTSWKDLAGGIMARDGFFLLVAETLTGERGGENLAALKYNLSSFEDPK
jgi:hypothetical protein